MKKMFLENLPKHKEGKNKGKINWKSSVGYKVRFIYDSIEGELEIIDYSKDTKNLSVIYKNKTFYICTDSFKDCAIGRVIGRITKEFKKEIGETIKDEKRDLVITDREYRNRNKNSGYIEKQKWYKYKCNKCNNEDWVCESNLIAGVGCNICNASTPRAKLGINTIWDTDRWMCDLGVSEEDAKRYSKGSTSKIKVKCPDCGNNKEVLVYNILHYKSIGCSCGDRFSYPEKFVVNLLNQIGVGFEVQLNKSKFDWCGKYRYDFYLPEYNMIIETNGIQHYEETNRKGARTLSEEQENDRLKRELALNNGIENYIVIDCRKSDMEYIKQNILKSKLNKLFDLSQIDWLKCEEFALSNLVKEICDYWNNKEEWETTQTIAENNSWGIVDRATIRKYLKKGTKLGWTNYNPKEEMRRVGAKTGKSKAKPIEVFKDGQSLGIFKSATELAIQSEELFGVKFDNRNISTVCTGKRRHHKGFTFRYVEKDKICNKEAYLYAV